MLSKLFCEPIYGPLTIIMSYQRTEDLLFTSLDICKDFRISSLHTLRKRNLKKRKILSLSHQAFKKFVIHFSESDMIKEKKLFFKLVGKFFQKGHISSVLFRKEKIQKKKMSLLVFENDCEDVIWGHSAHSRIEYQAKTKRMFALIFLTKFKNSVRALYPKYLNDFNDDNLEIFLNKIWNNEIIIEKEKVLIKICSLNKHRILNILGKTKHLDGMNFNKTLPVSVENGHFETVVFILKKFKISKEMIHTCVSLALKYNHHQILKFLLNYMTELLPKEISGQLFKELKTCNIEAFIVMLPLIEKVIQDVNAFFISLVKNLQYDHAVQLLKNEKLESRITLEKVNIERMLQQILSQLKRVKFSFPEKSKKWETIFLLIKKHKINPCCLDGRILIESLESYPEVINYCVDAVKSEDFPYKNDVEKYFLSNFEFCSSLKVREFYKNYPVELGGKKKPRKFREFIYSAGYDTIGLRVLHDDTSFEVYRHKLSYLIPNKKIYDMVNAKKNCVVQLHTFEGIRSNKPVELIKKGLKKVEVNILPRKHPIYWKPKLEIVKKKKLCVYLNSNDNVFFRTKYGTYEQVRKRIVDKFFNILKLYDFENFHFLYKNKKVDDESKRVKGRVSIEKEGNEEGSNFKTFQSILDDVYSQRTISTNFLDSIPKNILLYRDSYSGQTALHHSCIATNVESVKSIFKFAKENNYTKEEVINLINMRGSLSGSTCYHILVRKKKMDKGRQQRVLEILNILKENGSNFSKLDMKKRSICLVAFESENYFLRDWFLSNISMKLFDKRNDETSLNAKDFYFRKFVNLSITSYHIYELIVRTNRIFREIFSEGVDKEEFEKLKKMYWERNIDDEMIDVDYLGNMIHHYAMKNKFTTIKLFLNRWVKEYKFRYIFAKNMVGQTPLHIACLYGNFESFKELLGFVMKYSPRSLFTKDNSMKTCFHIAAEYKNWKILNCLLDTFNTGLIKKQKTEMILESDKYGNTLLDYLIIHKNNNILFSLIKKLDIPKISKEKLTNMIESAIKVRNIEGIHTLVNIEELKHRNISLSTCLRCIVNHKNYERNGKSDRELISIMMKLLKLCEDQDELERVIYVCCQNNIISRTLSYINLEKFLPFIIKGLVQCVIHETSPDDYQMRMKMKFREFNYLVKFCDDDIEKIFDIYLKTKKGSKGYPRIYQFILNWINGEPESRMIPELFSRCVDELLMLITRNLYTMKQKFVKWFPILIQSFKTVVGSKYSEERIKLPTRIILNLLKLSSFTVNSEVRSHNLDDIIAKVMEFIRTNDGVKFKDFVAPLSKCAIRNEVLTTNVFVNFFGKEKNLGRESVQLFARLFGNRKYKLCRVLTKYVPIETSRDACILVFKLLGSSAHTLKLSWILAKNLITNKNVTKKMSNEIIIRCVQCLKTSKNVRNFLGYFTNVLEGDDVIFYEDVITCFIQYFDCLDAKFFKMIARKKENIREKCFFILCDKEIDFFHQRKEYFELKRNIHCQFNLFVEHVFQNDLVQLLITYNSSCTSPAMCEYLLQCALNMGMEKFEKRDISFLKNSFIKIVEYIQNPTPKTLVKRRKFKRRVKERPDKMIVLMSRPEKKVYAVRNKFNKYTIKDKVKMYFPVFERCVKNFCKMKVKFGKKLMLQLIKLVVLGFKQFEEIILSLFHFQNYKEEGNELILDEEEFSSLFKGSISEKIILESLTRFKLGNFFDNKITKPILEFCLKKGFYRTSMSLSCVVYFLRGAEICQDLFEEFLKVVDTHVGKLTVSFKKRFVGIILEKIDYVADTVDPNERNFTKLYKKSVHKKKNTNKKERTVLYKLVNGTLDNHDGIRFINELLLVRNIKNPDNDVEFGLIVSKVLSHNIKSEKWEELFNKVLSSFNFPIEHMYEQLQYLQNLCVGRKMQNEIVVKLERKRRRKMIDYTIKKCYGNGRQFELFLEDIANENDRERFNTLEFYSYVMSWLVKQEDFTKYPEKIFIFSLNRLLSLICTQHQRTNITAGRSVFSKLEENYNTIRLGLEILSRMNFRNFHREVEDIYKNVLKLTKLSDDFSEVLNGVLKVILRKRKLIFDLGFFFQFPENALVDNFASIKQRFEWFCQEKYLSFVILALKKKMFRLASRVITFYAPKSKFNKPAEYKTQAWKIIKYMGNNKKVFLSLLYLLEHDKEINKKVNTLTWKDFETILERTFKECLKTISKKRLLKRKKIIRELVKYGFDFLLSLTNKQLTTVLASNIKELFMNMNKIPKRMFLRNITLRGVLSFEQERKLFVMSCINGCIGVVKALSCKENFRKVIDPFWKMDHFKFGSRSGYEWTMQLGNYEISLFLQKYMLKFGNIEFLKKMDELNYNGRNTFILQTLSENPELVVSNVMITEEKSGRKGEGGNLKMMIPLLGKESKNGLEIINPKYVDWIFGKFGFVFYNFDDMRKIQHNSEYFSGLKQLPSQSIEEMFFTLAKMISRCGKTFRMPMNDKKRLEENENRVIRFLSKNNSLRNYVCQNVTFPGLFDKNLVNLLHVACKKCCFNLVIYLFKQFSKSHPEFINMKDVDGLTPFDYLFLFNGELWFNTSSNMKEILERKLFKEVSQMFVLQGCVISESCKLLLLEHESEVSSYLVSVSKKE